MFWPGMAADTRKIPRFLGTPTYFDSVLPAHSPHISIGIDSLIGSITQRPHSHKGAWARILACQLRHYFGHDVKILTEDDDWEDFDVIVLDHGMEFDGVFNLFGGANAYVASRLTKFLVCSKPILSYEIQMPDLGKFITDRLKSCEPEFAALTPEIAHFTEKCKNTPMFDAVSYQCSSLLIGDSHSLSVWSIDDEIRRYDGKTLYGALKAGLSSFIPPHRNYDRITCYFGNIDIRHHLMRQSEPEKAVEELLVDYLGQLTKLKANAKTVRVVELLPIEDESRRLPKTGYYKGTPFYGTRDERENLRKFFNSCLHDLAYDFAIELIEWPKSLQHADGKLRFDVMERPGSVHLSPQYYMTDIDTGVRRNLIEIPFSDFSDSPINADSTDLVDSTSSAEPVKPAESPKPRRQSKGVKTASFEKTHYYDDFINYYRKAIQLQRKNFGLPCSPVDDDLMNAVTIYDSVNRRFAGFSKVLEDLHYGPEAIRYRQAKSKKKYEFTHAEWQYLHLVHRITGSGVSFEKDHGYRNSIIFELADELELGGFERAKQAILRWDQEKRSIFTSIGNQIPPFNKPTGPYTRGGIQYLCDFAPVIATKYAEYLEQNYAIGIRTGLRLAIDRVLELQTQLGLKRYVFVLTAFVMDTADYFPYYVDPTSHCYYGKNGIETLELVADISGKKELAYDMIVESLSAELAENASSFMLDFRAAGHPMPSHLDIPRSTDGSTPEIDRGFSQDKCLKPMDLEDCLCDVIRYWENHIPISTLGSYAHLDRTAVWNNSAIKDHPKGRQQWKLQAATVH